jgi:hypothetical protein
MAVGARLSVDLLQPRAGLCLQKAKSSSFASRWSTSRSRNAIHPSAFASRRARRRATAGSGAAGGSASAPSGCGCVARRHSVQYTLPGA